MEQLDANEWLLSIEPQFCAISHRFRGKPKIFHAKNSE
jgi:hypothetical protein